MNDEQDYDDQEPLIRVAQPNERPQYPDLPDLFRKSCKRMKREITEGFPAKMIALEAMQMLRAYFGSRWIGALQQIEDAEKAEFERLQRERINPDETV